MKIKDDFEMLACLERFTGSTWGAIRWIIVSYVLHDIFLTSGLLAADSRARSLNACIGNECVTSDVARIYRDIEAFDSYPTMPVTTPEIEST